jgi:hypothetical protein
MRTGKIKEAQEKQEEDDPHKQKSIQKRGVLGGGDSSHPTAINVLIKQSTKQNPDDSPVKTQHPGVHKSP